jgi:pimeloyl-ACP methyl ester carboxylesterase
MGASMERFLNAGYAVFSWDKPGTGESTGQLANHSGKLDQRASILVSAIERLKEHPAINPNQIGAWGHSQGGYVIPLAMRKTNDIVFIIIISGPGEDSYEQGAFLAGQMAFCAGASQAEAKRIEGYLSAIDKATTYQEYYTNATQLLNHPYYDHLDISLSLRSENQWVPEDTDNLAFFNPIDVVEKATIPILVVFGELDRQADPFQGKEAYQEALQKTGVQISQVTLYPDVDHNIVFAKTGCLSERSNRSLSEWMNYTPDYLDLLEAWLVQLHSHLSE